MISARYLKKLNLIVNLRDFMKFFIYLLRNSLIYASIKITFINKVTYGFFKNDETSSANAKANG